MNEACKILFEYRDFGSFAKVGGDNKTNLCEIYLAKWEQDGDEVKFTISANRFLRNMVRAIVGTMVEIGLGKIQPEGNEIKTQEVKIEEFSALHLEGNFKVSYIQSTENKLTVETYPNIFENLKIKVKDKELTISEKKKTEGVEVYNIILYSSSISMGKFQIRNIA